MTNETITWRGEEWEVVPDEEFCSIRDVKHLRIRPVPKPLREIWEVVDRRGFQVCYYRTQEEAESCLQRCVEISPEHGPYRVCLMREVRDE